MWTNIVSFIMPYITKYVLPVISTICIILFLTIGILYSDNKDLHKELGEVKAISEQNNLLYERERLKAKTVIDTQNDRISKYEINATAYSKAIHTKEKALIEARITQQQQLDKELNIDSSADNQLRILTKIMKDFSNEMD